MSDGVRERRGESLPQLIGDDVEPGREPIAGRGDARAGRGELLPLTPIIEAEPEREPIAGRGDAHAGRGELLLLFGISVAEPERDPVAGNGDWELAASIICLKRQLHKKTKSAHKQPNSHKFLCCFVPFVSPIVRPVDRLRHE